MAEYIEREAVLTEMTSKPLPSDAQHLYLDMRGIVRKAPTADVVEVKHGRWIWQEVHGIVKNETFLACSVCHEIRNADKEHKYCPNCGAKMDGATDTSVGDKLKKGAEE